MSSYRTDFGVFGSACPNGHRTVADYRTTCVSRVTIADFMDIDINRLCNDEGGEKGSGCNEELHYSY